MDAQQGSEAVDHPTEPGTTPTRARTAGSRAVLGCLGLAVLLVAGAVRLCRWAVHSTTGVDLGLMQMEELSKAVEEYRLLKKELPRDLDVLTRPGTGASPPMLQGIPRDPWGNAYEYRTTSDKGYTIRSHGEDGQPNTEDDIVHVPSATR